MYKSLAKGKRKHGLENCCIDFLPGREEAVTTVTIIVPFIDENGLILWEGKYYAFSCKLNFNC